MVQRAQRIHAQIDRVIPRRKPREVANDFNLAHFRHVAEVFAFAAPSSFSGVDLRHIQRRQFLAALAGRRLLEDQTFVLIDVARGLADHVLHGIISRTPSSSKASSCPPGWSAHSPRSRPRPCQSRYAWSVRCSTTRGITQLRIKLLQRQAPDNLVAQQPAVDGFWSLR